MSLLKQNEISINEEREELTTESAVLEKIAVKRRKQQKEQRHKHISAYKNQRDHIDSLDFSELEAYLRQNKKLEMMPRAGMHSMKVNAYEGAIIKHAQEKLGMKSSRELFIFLIKKALRRKGGRDDY